VNQRLNRALVILHRWLGIVLAVIVVLWFFSGVVTMYVGYPKLTQKERLVALPVLSAQTCCIPLAVAWRQLPPGSKPQSVTLTSIANRPAYKFDLGPGFFVVDAVSGALQGEVTPRRALNAAHAFIQAGEVRYLGIVDEDMWTRSSRLHVHRPLHRLQVDDSLHTRLYVSSTTGEVVLDATRSERLWNFVGPWLHWLHMIRGHHEAWRILIIGVTLLGLGLSLAGTYLGIDRWRFKGHHANGRKTPYRNSFMRWHHVTGLLFGILTITWIFSGLMSINPWGVFGTGAQSLEMEAFSGGELKPERFQVDSRQALAILPQGFGTRELEWHLLDGQPYFVARDGRGRIRIEPGLADVAPLHRFTDTELRRAAANLIAGAAMVHVDMLSTYDSYYYPRDTHALRGDYDRSLPVFRAQFNDPSRTWVYVNPHTGTVIMSLSSRERVERWLFFMLHSWDIHALLVARPLWDLLLISLSIGGLSLAVTGTVIGVRRVRVKFGGRRP
jgi:uncharacterized iron-regulated membrane protein